MMKKRTVACLLLAVAACAFAVTPDASLVQTSGEPSVAAGKFYGYRTKTDGPGEQTLEKAQALAEAKHVPLVVVWGEEQCPHCNAFITQMNAASADVAAFLSTNRAVFTFFKADTPDDGVPDSTYTPKVVYDAYAFAMKTCGGRLPFPIYGFYFKCGYPSRQFAKVNAYAQYRLYKLLNRKSQRRYRLKYAETYYGELQKLGLVALTRRRYR